MVSKTKKTRIEKAALEKKGIVIEKSIEEADKSNLKADYDSSPELARDAWTEAVVPQIGTDFKSIIIAGMGGSGIIGDIVSDLATEKGSIIRFQSVKDYHLPRWADENTIVVGISCSGNTEETLSVLSEARRKGLQGFTFGSGGLIGDYSKMKWTFKFTKTRMLKVPRSSLPGLFFPVLKFFVENSIIDLSEQEVVSSFNELQKVRNICGGVSSSNPALDLARIITGLKKEPLVYSSSRTKAVGLRFRQSLNENAKIHAFNGEIPELCHNDVVGWDSVSASAKEKKGNQDSLSDSFAIATRLKEDDPPEIRTRFDVVRSLIEKNGGQFREAPYSGYSYLGRLLSMLYSLDYVAYYCAVLRTIDPIRTPSIDFLKRYVARKLDFLKQIQ